MVFCFLPFIPIFIAVVLGSSALGAGLATLLIKIFEDPTINMNLAVLGMPAAGKTTWWNYLQGGKKNKENQQQTVSEEIIPLIQIVCNDKKYQFIDCKDIGGVDENVQAFYKELIKKSDKVLFFFDMSKYLKDTDYSNNVNSRLDLIYKNEHKKVFLVLTHADRVADRNKVKAEIYQRLMSKPYRDICKDMIDINMLDENELNNLLDKIL